jgi:hypothetical protein
MSAVDALKRAPKWTWFVVGGVGLGSVAIKMYQGRDAEAKAAAAGDGTPAGDAGGGTAYPTTTGGSPPGVIVPPIITGGDGGSIGDLGAAFAGLFGSTITDLSELTGRAIDANASNNGQWIDAFSQANQSWVGYFGQGNSQWIDALAAAGSAPQPVAQNPTPVIVNVTGPAPAAPVASPPTARHAPNPEYPLYQETGSRAGHWYKVVLKDGKRYRWYDNGDKVLA